MQTERAENHRGVGFFWKKRSEESAPPSARKDNRSQKFTFLQHKLADGSEQFHNFDTSFLPERAGKNVKAAYALRISRIFHAKNH